jgi:hypothetical protein
MGIVVEADGVLRDQHLRVLADAPGGRLAMGMQQRLQIHLRVVEEPIGGFALTGRAVQRRTDGGGRVLAKRLGHGCVAKDSHSKFHI